MKTITHVGIWMDHSMAHIMELKENKIVSNTIKSAAYEGEKQNYGKDESLKQNKEQNQLNEYFSKLTNVIKDYQFVLLFGPTDAKNELYNLLKTDHLFDGIRLEVEPADKLTENQMHAFVREYFDNSEK